ncbi:MAG TPA: DUF84 family protein [Candidatus Saccharimonadales bacterium]|nr:DUF84 family protein [Candidatus Saccharimonadales bacterium]
MKIAICGSMQHLDAMLQAKELLELLGYEVETPHPREEKVVYGTLSISEQIALKDQLIREHLDKIKESDAIFVYNEDKKGIGGYVGGNTLMEMAFAYAQGTEIFLLKTPNGVSYTEEILGMRPININSKIEAIDEYFKILPKTFVSSKSPIKLRAVSRGLRKAGLRTYVLPHPTESGVSEQPRTVDETYQGAETRHQALKEQMGETSDYLATIETGWAQMHPRHNNFGVIITILERVGSKQEIGIHLGVETPKELTDKIPSQYPDMGVLVQKEFGSILKDPLPFFTNGKLTRLSLTEAAVFNVATRLGE